jgi:hypothetical protein
MTPFEITSTLITIFSLLTSLLALTLAWRSWDNSKLNQRAEIFLNLRSRFNSIHEFLPDYVFNSQSIPQKDTSDWRIIERYWLLSFDEWFITKYVISYDKEFLWFQSYKKVQQSSLRNTGMREVLKVMFAGRISFGEKRDEYLKEIKKMECELQINDIQQIS